jgi:hypothetical protein
MTNTTHTVKTGRNEPLTLAPPALAFSIGAGIDFKKHPLWLEWRQRARAGHEALLGFERYLRSLALMAGLKVPDIEAEVAAIRDLRRDSHESLSGETLAEKVLVDAEASLKSYVAGRLQASDYVRGRTEHDLRKVEQFYDWARRSKLTGIDKSAIEKLIQELPATKRQPGARRFFDFNPDSLDRARLCHVVTGLISGFEVWDLHPKTPQLLLPQEEPDQIRPTPLCVRLGFRELCALKLGDFSLGKEQLTVPNLQEGGFTTLQLTTETVAKLAKLVDLSRVRRICAWGEDPRDLEESPLFLSFDGGALAVDGYQLNGHPEALSWRGALVDDFVRSYKFGFWQVVHLRRGNYDFEEARGRGRLSFLDEERGPPRCCLLSPRSIELLRLWTGLRDALEPSDLSPEQRKLQPLLCGGDGGSLIADPALGDGVILWDAHKI